MTEKFTPGEWKVFHHKDEFMKSFDWREIVTKETPPKALAHIMYYEEMPQEEYEANATLIAAAPEMYRMLEQLSEYFHKLGKQRRSIKMYTIANRIDSVLKKARGGE